MNYFTSKANRVLAALLLICFLLPLFAGAVAASQRDISLPIWNGGASESFSGNGTRNNPYQINTPQDLALLAQQVRSGVSYSEKHFRINHDICLNATSSYENWKDSPPLRTWTPIGGYAAISIDSVSAFEEAVEQYNGLYIRREQNYQPATAYSPSAVYYRLTTFDGILDGQGHSIIGLYLSGDEPQVGLFGALGNATVQNLNLSYTYAEGSKQVGILAGSIIASKTAEINGIHVNGKLSATSTGGGLVGSIQSTGIGKVNLTDCSFTGSIDGDTDMGGIIGKTDGISGSINLTDCMVNGKITADLRAGGIIGNLAGAVHQLTACKNNASLQGSEETGGIVGFIDPSVSACVLDNCLNGGTIFSVNMAGGIVGSIQTSSGTNSLDILNCRNIGEVHASVSIGGIVGQALLSGTEVVMRIQSSKNSALLSGFCAIGGIIGTAQIGGGIFSIIECENYGDLTASGDGVGGIAGTILNRAQVTLSRNSVRASIQTASSFAGGIAGTLYGEAGTLLVEQSVAAGSVQAISAVGGCVGEIMTKTAGSSVQVINCLAVNLLSASQSLGGIAGHLYAEQGNASILTSVFDGKIVLGSKVTGGIVSELHAIHKDAVALVEACYFIQNSASVAAHLRGGEGTEAIRSAESRNEEAFHSIDQLFGLDQTIWKSNSNGGHAVVPGDVPVVWEEYKYTVTQNGVIINAYMGRSDIVCVPERLENVSVTVVAEQAFWQNTVVRVILPDTITAIGEAAFAGCAQLERITLPSALISIGARAFSECTSLAELRCTGLLSSVVVGSENQPYKDLSITRPLSITVQHLYEDGTMAGKATTLTCYEGDYYRIDPLSINGYKADEQALYGIGSALDRITITYRIGTYHLTILYQFPDGSEASPSFEGDFVFGEKYSVSTPILDGYKAEYTLIEGTMDGKDTQIIVHYTEIFNNSATKGQQTLQIVLLILSGLIIVCCLSYFVYRYRSVSEQARLENEAT